jgi:hypothetical protein
MGDVNRDYHRRVRPRPTDATAADRRDRRLPRPSRRSCLGFLGRAVHATDGDADTAWKRDDATRGRRLSYGRDAPTSF